MTEQTVTLVTRNKQHPLRTTLVELSVYAGILYFIVNPSKIEAVQEKLRRVADRAAHRVSVMRARAAIQSLPETREP